MQKFVRSRVNGALGNIYCQIPFLGILGVFDDCKQEKRKQQQQQNNQTDNRPVTSCGPDASYVLAEMPNAVPVNYFQD